ncbi:MAG: transcriptional regulator [Candidatus Poribacteria bacterium]|nr:transcriptional regulator [Candidatus Poribacteria bacterium]
MNYEIQETRSQILRLLKIHSNMAANELAGSLGISSMGVRQHLAILERDGLVDHHRKKTARGRPKYVYHLTDKANELFPAAYGRFAISLLKEVEKLNGFEGIDKVFQNRMVSQAEVYKQRLADKELDERVKELAEIRDEEGYMAEVTQEGEDYVLTEYNCPIAMIAEKYPHACDAELALFRHSLGTEVMREEHLMKGSHKCTYRIAKTSKSQKS